MKKLKVCFWVIVLVIGVFFVWTGINRRGKEEVQKNEEVQREENMVTDEIYVMETFEKTISADSFEEWIMHTYYKMSDGTWRVDLVDEETGNVETLSYLYRVVLHDRMPNAAVDSNYIILSNRDDITFKQAYMASGFSSLLDDYFTKEEAMFVSSWAGPLEANHPIRDKDTIYVMGHENEWGVELQVIDVTEAGLKIECTQSGGNPSGELQTGSYYIVEKKIEGDWEAVEYLIDNVGWTAEAWMIPTNATVTWDVDWEWLYGKLPSGDYRIGKEIMDFRGPGDFDKKMFYVEFGI